MAEEAGSMLDMEKLLESLKEDHRTFFLRQEILKGLAEKALAQNPSVRFFTGPCSECIRNQVTQIVFREGEEYIPVFVRYARWELSGKKEKKREKEIERKKDEEYHQYLWIRDLQMMELMTLVRPGCRYGYVLWMSDDERYWQRSGGVSHPSFDTWEGTKYGGIMRWAVRSLHRIHREYVDPIVLYSAYQVKWKQFSPAMGKLREVKYALMKITREEVLEGICTTEEEDSWLES